MEDDGIEPAPMVQENLSAVCVICPHKSYVNPDDIQSAKRTSLKQPAGAETCNKYAKQRKMDVVFKVCT